MNVNLKIKLKYFFNQPLTCIYAKGKTFASVPNKPTAWPTGWCTWIKPLSHFLRRKGWILGIVVLLKNSTLQNQRRLLKCFLLKNEAFLVVVKLWTLDTRENFECSPIHVTQWKPEGYMVGYIQIRRFPERTLVLRDADSRGVQAAGTWCPGSPPLPWDLPVLSSEHSTGLACSLEIDTLR